MSLYWLFSFKYWCASLDLKPSEAKDLFTGASSSLVRGGTVTFLTETTKDEGAEFDPEIKYAWVKDLYIGTTFCVMLAWAVTVNIMPWHTNCLC